MNIIKNLLKYIISKGWQYSEFGKSSVVIKPLLIKNSKYIKIGKNVYIRSHSRLEVVLGNTKSNKNPMLFIGDNTNIEQGAHITCGGSLYIGNNCSITPYVTITDIKHEYEDINTPVKMQKLSFFETIINDDCFIGTGAVILPGAHIGKHSVVGANSVVMGSFPEYSVIAGNPAKLIKKYDPKIKQWVKV